MRQLLEDINSEFSSEDRDANSEYFIGTIVTCLAREDDDVYQLIDGQQRVTTAYLTLCSIRDYLKKLEASEIKALGQQISASSTDSKGNDIFVIGSLCSTTIAVGFSTQSRRTMSSRMAKAALAPEPVLKGLVYRGKKMRSERPADVI